MPFQQEIRLVEEADETHIGSDGLIDEIRNYWKGRNIPQRWYSNKTPLSLAWFNEIARRRYTTYYSYLASDAEFSSHAGEKIIEIGVGIGTDLVEFAKGGAHIYGIDLGQEQIDLTRLNLEIHGLKYKELSVQNAMDIQYPSGFFDLVYSFGVLHHAPDTGKCLQEVHRILKEDGQAIIMLYARGWKHYIKRCFIQGLLRGKYFKYGSWQAVYDDVSEVNGGSPRTAIFTKKQVRDLFRDFAYVEIKKKRLGEFFDYKPYGTVMLPRFIARFLYWLGAESVLGENYLIKAYKAPRPPKTSLRDVLFKHY